MPWETVLDLDALGAAEHENWTWKGMTCLGPSYRRCLVSLSRGGADATVVREFDSVDKRFVEGGFTLPEAKSSVTWIDADSIFVATDFGAGSLTDSGYPRIVKRWRRGTPLAAATTVFEALASDVSADVSVDRTPGYERTVLAALDRLLEFEALSARRRQARLPIDVPDDSEVSFVRDTIFIELRSDWKIGRADLRRRVAARQRTPTAYLAGGRDMTVLFAPTKTRSLAGWTHTRDYLILDVLDNVASRLVEVKKEGGALQEPRGRGALPRQIGVAALYDPLVDGVPAEKGQARRCQPPPTAASPNATGSATSTS